MSEYQYVAFRAIDRPLTDEELEFAETQSSRAEITRWSFTNEYHYGDFGGDSEKLLLNGYDVHLHYASFGIHTIQLRLPAGLPFSRKVWKNYIDGERVSWKEFKTPGRGGVLSVSPDFEPGDVDYIEDPDSYLDLAVEIREALIRGDLRVLYVLWLCGMRDAYSGEWETVEPPVPAGLAQVSDACSDLTTFYGLNPLMLVAAAEQSAPAFERVSEDEIVAQWVKSQTSEDCRELVRRLLLDKTHQVRAETMAQIGSQTPTADWPTTPGTRTFEQLWKRTEQLREEEKERERIQKEKAVRQEAEQKAKARQERMVKIAKEPAKWLKEADRLAALRAIVHYEAAAEILDDLKHAVGGEKGRRMAQAHADKLVAKYPTLNHLKSALRKRGLL